MTYSTLLNLTTFLLSIQLSVHAQPAAGRNRFWLWVLLLLIASVVVAWFLGREEQRNAVAPVTPARPAPPKQEPPVVKATRSATVDISPAAPASAVAEDDLTKIEGIGPKINLLLHEHGFRTYADVAQADAATLKQVLVDAGLRIHNPATWPEQAALAATGDWDGLTALQAQLSAGRRATS